MPMAQLNQVVRQLRRTAGAAALADWTDRELLAQFVTGHDETAFAALVQRHGAMVLGVCWRVLRHQQDAEDAFQATFLVLARQAGAKVWQASIGPWLHEVAQRTALKARGLQARRGAQEKQVLAMPEPEALPGADARELSAALDAELQCLPDKFRGALVLCHLEGLGREEAARRLGLTVAAVKDRLERGRELLRQRLTRRGITLSAAFLATGFVAGNAPAAVPPHLVAGLLEAACASLAGQPLGTSVTPTVLTLTEGVLETMNKKKLPLLASLVLGFVGLGTGAGLLTQATAEPPAPPTQMATVDPVQPLARPDDDKKNDDKKATEIDALIRSVDATKNQITVKLDENDFDTTYDLSKDAKVFLATRAVKLTDLKANMVATLVMSAQDAQTVAEIKANWRPIRTNLKAVDAAKNTLTIELEQNDVAFETVLAIDKDARVVIDGLNAGIGDLGAGREVELQLGADKKSVIGIKADRDKDELPVTIKEVDATKNQVVILFDDDDKLPAIAFDLAQDAKFRLTGKDVALADLKPGMPALLKLGADRKTVVAVRADLPKPKKTDDD